MADTLGCDPRLFNRLTEREFQRYLACRDYVIARRKEEVEGA